MRTASPPRAITVEKTYQVMAGHPGRMTPGRIVAKSVQLHNEKDLTKPAVLEILTPLDDLRLTISEGRYHQVKRMFAAIRQPRCGAASAQACISAR